MLLLKKPFLLFILTVLPDVLVFSVLFAIPSFADSFREFAHFVENAILGVWVLGRLSAAGVTVISPKGRRIYVAICAVTMMVLAFLSILDGAGNQAIGVGEFPGWGGIASIPDILGLLRYEWMRRGVFDGALLFAIAFWWALFVVTAWATRSALKAKT